MKDLMKSINKSLFALAVGIFTALVLRYSLTPEGINNIVLIPTFLIAWVVLTIVDYNK